MRHLVSIIGAALAGALIVIGCSDDSPADADAATCDCPAAERPLAASRIHRVDGAGTAATNTITSPIALCPAGELFLSGSCYIDQDNTAREVSLMQSGAVPSGATEEARAWQCHFLNTSPTATAEVRAQAMCLRP